MTDQPHHHHHGHSDHGSHAHGGGAGHSHHHHELNPEAIFNGDTYWKWPGVRETGIKTASTFGWAMQQAGVGSTNLAKLSLLEVGCGGGAATPHLAAQVSSVHAIDVQVSMLSAFSSRLSALPTELQNKITYSLLTLSSNTADEFSGGAAQPAPTPDDPDRKVNIGRAEWDAAVITNVLHHVSDPEGFFAGLTQVIKPKDLNGGGSVVIIEPHGMHPPSGEVYDVSPLREDQVMSRETLQKLKSHGHHHSTWYTPEAIVEMMQKHGMVDIKQEMHGTMPTQGVGEPESGCLVTWGRIPPS